MAAPAIGFTTRFPLDPSILGPGSSATIDISPTTDHDVIQAILANTPFPDRQIDIGSIGVNATTGNVSFAAGPGTVGFQASASLKTGMGVFKSAADAIKSLQLD